MMAILEGVAIALAVAGGILAAALTVVLSIYSYNSGKKSGNVTASTVLLISGVFIVTLIPGICHLAGALKSEMRIKPEKENIEPSFDMEYDLN